ncbi:MAG: nucleoside triphosphate pyrophosphohydrolase [Anaerolineales bacterium]
MSGLTLLGLGPGHPHQLTCEARDVLAQASELWVRTRQHPVLEALPPSLTIHSFDAYYEEAERFEEVYQRIVEKVWELAQRPEGVIYAVPGHPFVAEATCPLLAKRAKESGMPLRIVSGMSFLEPTFAALQLDPYPRLYLVDALLLSDAHIPPLPPDVPILVAQIYSRRVAAEVKTTLNTIYPDEHLVYLVHAAGTSAEKVEALPLYEIDRRPSIGLLTSLYVPPLEEGTSFEAFQEIVAHLRAPEGCPWDRQQTHQSLRTHLLQEAYEVLEAIDAENMEALREELGDLLLQIVLQAQIAMEEGEFNINQVIQGIYRKIIRRHPHVFGDLKVANEQEVLANWEKFKAEERAINGEAERGLLDGVPQALPALTQAQEYQARAARVGFDWPQIDGVVEKIWEEIQELRHAEDGPRLGEEFGDLLFALVNLARWKGIDAESALRKANVRFRQRFAYIEQEARRRGVSLADLSLQEMDDLWQQAKEIEKRTR